METREKVVKIAQAVKNAGGRAMLVGGCVRDFLLNIPVKDYDLELYGRDQGKLLEAVASVCEFDPVGMSFGVLKVRHYDIDIAFPRRENKIGSGHRGFLVELDGDLDFAAASSRRDFTVNAIMQDVLTGEIIDPHGGQADLRCGVLRHISSAFSEDPLRVLRGMQFIARFGFSPADETVRLCSQLSQNELPQERIAGEWEKMLLKGNFISRGLEFLRQTRWINNYPSLKALINCPQNPVWHPEGDVWNHTLSVTDAAAELRSRENEYDALVLMLSALCHDFGKALCTVVDSDGKITSCGHDMILDPAEKFISAIWRRRDMTERVLSLISRHMHPWQLADSNSSDKAYRKLALHVKRLDLLADLAEADVRGIKMTADEQRTRLEKIDFFRRRCRELQIADQVPEPLILGRHLIARGMRPGVDFKPLLDRCFEAQLAGEFSSLETGLQFLDNLLCGK